VKILAAESMKLNKLKMHLETVHAEFVGKTVGYMKRELSLICKMSMF
jgi:hypothetical protein